MARRCLESRAWAFAYYSQFKVTGDVASALKPLIEGKKDHVFGVGVEANVFLPKPKLLIGFRAVPAGV